MSVWEAVEQYGDHCALTFAGEDWWITSKAGDLIFLRNETGNTIIDISRVNWSAYIVAAWTQMQERFPCL